MQRSNLLDPTFIPYKNSYRLANFSNCNFIFIIFNIIIPVLILLTFLFYLKASYNSYMKNNGNIMNNGNKNNYSKNNWNNLYI